MEEEEEEVVVVVEEEEEVVVVVACAICCCISWYPFEFWLTQGRLAMSFAILPFNFCAPNSICPSPFEVLKSSFATTLPIERSLLNIESIKIGCLIFFWFCVNS